MAGLQVAPARDRVYIVARSLQRSDMRDGAARCGGGGGGQVRHEQGKQRHLAARVAILLRDVRL
eukprot:2377144-Rhodomonas_salina.2